ncbi:unnamed protein product [Lepidochelys kempii]
MGVTIRTVTRVIREVLQLNWDSPWEILPHYQTTLLWEPRVGGEVPVQAGAHMALETMSDYRLSLCFFVTSRASPRCFALAENVFSSTPAILPPPPSQAAKRKKPKLTKTVDWQNCASPDSDLGPPGSWCPA